MKNAAHGAKITMSATDTLLDNCAASAADQVIAGGRPAFDAAGSGQLLAAARDRLAAVTADVVAWVAQVLAEARTRPRLA